MAYYAALVSFVELLKEMSHSIPGHQYPKYLFQEQRITRLYEKFSHLEVLLEDYSPKDNEADGFLERIRDVACRVELIIERKTSDVTCLERSMPDAAYEAKCMIEFRVSDQVREPNCLEGLMHLVCFPIFVSAFHNSEPVNEGVVETMRKGYKELLKLAEVLGCVVENQYDDLEELKKDVDSIMAEGYLDVVTLKEEIDSIAIKGYQDLLKLSEEIGAISGEGYRDLDTVEEEVDSILGKGHQDSERVKEEVDSVVGKGYDELMEKVLKKEVDPIVEELVMRIKDSHTTRQEDLQVTVGGSSDDGTTMVVLDENPTIIKAQLFRDSSKLEVISIVGMGGIGKTTLARNIFDDKLINDRFDFSVWVTISQGYHLRNILQAIANSLNINNGAEDGVLKKHIYQHLFRRRYLVIMDDVWDTKIWDDIRWIFPNDNKSRSRIIITTRQSNVASIASQPDFINQIQPLTHDQSWTLFCEKVLCPPELVDIGRLIVRNCGGLPLAIVVVAGLLSETSKTRDRWGNIARRVSSTVAANDEHFLKILSLSYDHLPHHLKPCFLYLGGFPEDYEISVSRLIKLWIAEGFLKPVASKCLEEAAEDYLEELVKRNLVLVTKQRSNGQFKSCIMHDLLRDLCLERARREHFLLLPHKHIGTDHIHRFFIHPNSPSDIDLHKNNARHVRSIVSFGNSRRRFISHPSIFKPVRVFDAPFIDFSFPDDRIFELTNLRFLVLVLPRIDIPSSISQLQNLQTLIVHSRLPEISLPDEIWKMPQLRHVLIDRNTKLPHDSDGGWRMFDRLSLKMLRTMSTLLNFTFTSGIAEMFPSMKKLKLEYVQKNNHSENVWRKFGLNNLVHLHQIETLAIAIHVSINTAIPFPESFAFPTNLRKLTLKGCQLPWRNMTAVGALPRLQVLKLRWDSFVGEEWESKEGEFPKLKFLEMKRLYGIKNWRTESCHFPSLEHLVIKYCRNLKEVPSETGEFPNLKLIEVWSNDSRVKVSALEIQEEQSSAGNETLQVRVHARIW